MKNHYKNMSNPTELTSDNPEQHNSDCMNTIADIPTHDCKCNLYTVYDEKYVYDDTKSSDGCDACKQNKHCFECLTRIHTMIDSCYNDDDHNHDDDDQNNDDHDDDDDHNDDDDYNDFECACMAYKYINKDRNHMWHDYFDFKCDKCALCASNSYCTVELEMIDEDECYISHMIHSRE